MRRDAATQDFILANNQTFFCRNATEYVLLATRLEEGKPLGGINCVRAAAYDVVSTLRHEKNGTPRREPTEHEATAAS
jgi:hypothetical protein